MSVKSWKKLPLTWSNTESNLNFNNQCLCLTFLLSEGEGTRGEGTRRSPVDGICSSATEPKKDPLSHSDQGFKLLKCYWRMQWKPKISSSWSWVYTTPTTGRMLRDIITKGLNICFLRLTKTKKCSWKQYSFIVYM